MADEVIAVFKADIEQFKAQMAELQRTIKGVDLPLNNLVDKFGVPFRKAADGATDSADKFGRSTKSASNSISTLSRGLGGITGLLGVTGRLFGVNTDKLEGLIFASQQFVRVGRDIANTQKLSSAAMDGAQVATARLTIAQRLYALVVGESVGAMAAFKIALAATGIGLAVVALTALVSSFRAAKEATEAKEKAAKKLREENNKLNESIVAVQKKEDELALSRGVSSKLITERQAEEIKATTKNLENLQKIKSEQKIKLDADGKAEFILDDITKQKLLIAERDYQLDLSAIKDKFDKLDAEAKKKEAEQSLKERESSLQREFAAFVKYWDDIDKKNRDAQKAILEEQKVFAANKQKLIEDEFVEEQDSAAKNREIGAAATKKRLDEEKEANNKRIKAAQDVADIIFTAQQEAFDKRQELLDKEIDAQATNIETQRRLAEAGLANTLAFEEKRAADLRRQQQVEAERQKKIKLLETFLNSLAEFSKTDPKTAIQKALLQVALATAASAVFAEEGGIIGEIGHTSNLRRRHKGGGDVLLHAQTGEGILSRREMDNLGKRNFHLLKDAARFPIRDDVFGMPKIAMAGGMAISNAEVVKELQALRKDIRNQPRESWEVNKFGDYIKTSIENGVTEVTKGKMPKPRFK